MIEEETPCLPPPPPQKNNKKQNHNILLSDLFLLEMKSISPNKSCKIK